MSFLHPEFLYYMLPPLFILFGLLLTQKEAEATFFSDEVMAKLRVSANTLTLKARNALFMLIGILIVIALAGPVINEGTVEVKAKSADIMIALDISDSMLAEDIYPNRLELAKLKAMELLKSAPNERIGVIAFAKNSYLVSPLSFDHSAVGFLLRQLDTTSITEKGTDFLSMLEVVDSSVKKESKKYLLVLSDGGDSDSFSEEIAFAKKHNIAVFVLGLGTQKGAPIKQKNGEFIKHNGEIIVSKLNENIADFATKSGGVYIESVKSDRDIKAMLSEIEKHSEKKELKSQEIARFIPLFYFPLSLALLLLLIATSSMSKREKMQLPSAFLLFGLLFTSPNAEAGLLDFMKLQEAKEAYSAQDYEKSSQLYSEYGDVSNSGESHYNSANSLYKQGRYDEAIESYKKATFSDENSRASNYANMANAYVKQQKEGSLQKAVESYEKSLKIKEDKETRENLEAVKKAIEEQKKEEESQEDKNKDKDSKDDKEGEKDKDSKDGEKSEEDKKESDEKQEKSDKEEDSSKSKESEDKQDNSDDMKSKKESEESKTQENNETKEEEQKQDLKEL
ncbi:MAG: VWA domain-containing protein, partial [Campylobacterota bacterium]|nr:VWA domain-containing protein [Campylobacterota bacterium]